MGLGITCWARTKSGPCPCEDFKARGKDRDVLQELADF